MASWFRRLRVFVLSVVRRQTRAERELKEELLFHLECETQERVRAGLGPGAARSAAMRAMGALEKSKEECRDLWRGGRIGDVLDRLHQDVRFASRLFRRRPGPILIAIGGLALTIGVVTAVFSIVNASMLRPYGMDDPSTVVRVTREDHHPLVGWPYTHFLRMQEGPTLARVEASSDRLVPFSVERTDEPVPRRSLRFVSGGYLQLLGGRPAEGRSLGPDDDTAGAPPVIVVSHHFWQTALAADPAAVGKFVWVNDKAVRLVGVLQPQFTGPESKPAAVWAPFASMDELGLGPAVTRTAGPAVHVIARLPPVTEFSAVQARLTALASQSDAPASPSVNGKRAVGVRLYRAASPLDAPLDGEAYVALAGAFGLAGLVLALACTNASNILLAFAATRMAEVRVRLALGATRRRLVTQLSTESLLLGAMAGGVGFVIAFWLVPIFGAAVEMPPEVNLNPDGHVLFFAAALALICGLGVAIAPVRYAARGHVLTASGAGHGVVAHGAIHSRVRSSFVGLQAAVSMLLLVLAALVVRTTVHLSGSSIGFDADRLLIVTLEPLRSGLDQPGFVRTAVEAVRRVPTVEGVSVTEHEPYGWSRYVDRFTFGGRSFELRTNFSDASFFSTAGIRILRGRGFTDDEVAQQAPVAVISDTVARTFYPGTDPIGLPLSAVPASGGPQPAATIVGIVVDAMLDGPEGQIHGGIYRPLTRQPSHAFTDSGLAFPPSLIVRSSNPAMTVRAVEAAIMSVESQVRPVTRLARDGIERYLSAKRRLAWLLGPMALLSLLLAIVGIYGVTAFVVSQRLAEASVRMALGASPAGLFTMIAKDGLRPVLVGLTLGLGMALGIGRVIEQELGGVSAHDPLAIGTAVGALLTCAVVAVVVPARRAARADPARLLREC